MTDERPGWDRTWMDVARVTARRSKCSRRRVGAVIVTPTQQLVASGYNGEPSSAPVSGPCIDWCPRAQNPDSAGVGYDNCVSLHAEMNALLFLDRPSREGGTLYSTSAVCYGCSKAIGNSGLHRVVHIVSDEDAHRQPKLAEEYLHWAGLEVVRWQD